MAWCSDSAALRSEVAVSSPKDYRRFLETRGVALDALGLAEGALRREDALFAVDLVEAEGGTILGGDVYVEHDGVESAHANWYSERRDDEPSESFAARSRAESRSYITKYPDPPEGQALFVLIVAEAPRAE
jgi:hypothetical protein